MGKKKYRHDQKYLGPAGAPSTRAWQNEGLWGKQGSAVGLNLETISSHRGKNLNEKEVVPVSGRKELFFTFSPKTSNGTKPRPRGPEKCDWACMGLLKDLGDI